MYVHIGGEVTLAARWILAVLDLDLATSGRSEMKDFLRQAEVKGCLTYVGNEIPRSIVVTVETVYITAVSAATLHKRLKEGLN